MLKRILGIAPHREVDGSYSPSKLALKLARSDTSDYQEVTYAKSAGTRKKVLVVCTEHKNMRMQNGKSFSTGNHPVELLVPMLHMSKAGFEFEFATPAGRPVVLEMWAFPKQDKHVKSIYATYETAMNTPMSLKDSMQNLVANPEQYAAVFVPGGHGAMIGLPDDGNLGELLLYAHENGIFTITLCHGPGALLATSNSSQGFIYSGYEMTVFPDSVDDMTPKIGYLPGKMPWKVCEKLTNAGAKITNKKADASVRIDRRLITGASPQAADALGKLATNSLLEAFG